MPSIPRLTNRSPNFVELVLHNSTDVAGYRFSAANTLNTAFTSPTAMFTVPRGGTYKSISLRRRGVGTSIYTSRGLTFAQYDPEDFWVGGGSLPHDAGVSYVVVEEQNSAGVFRPAGPVLIVPAPGFFTNTRPALTISGTAPNVAATSTGTPPAGALRFVLPRFADSCTITNSGGASMYVAFDDAYAEFEVFSNSTTLLADGAVSEIIVRGDGATVPFSIFCAVVNAEMA